MMQATWQHRDSRQPLQAAIGNASLRDVARPWLSRRLGVSLGAVVAVAQQLSDYGRWYLSDEVLQRGVLPLTAEPQTRGLIHLMQYAD
jgi:hypothetical protein